MVSVYIIPFYFLLMVVLIGYNIVGTFLIIRAYKVQLPNLFFIGIGFILVAIGIIGNIIFTLGRFFQVHLLSFGYLLLAIFIYKTFHKKKSTSNPRLIITLIIFLLCIRIIVGWIKELILTPITYYADLIIVNIYVFIIFFWLGQSASKDYKKLKKRDIEPWIKIRYRLIAISAYVFLFQGLTTFLIPWNVKFGDPSNILSYLQFSLAVILGTIFCIGMILAWIMPPKFKKYLNRDYNGSLEKELSEKDLISIIKKQLREDDEGGND